MSQQQLPSHWRLMPDRSLSSRDGAATARKTDRGWVLRVHGRVVGKPHVRAIEAIQEADARGAGTPPDIAARIERAVEELRRLTR